jgi:hypothetical protein
MEPGCSLKAMKKDKDAFQGAHILACDQQFHAPPLKGFCTEERVLRQVRRSASSGKGGSRELSDSEFSAPSMISQMSPLLCHRVPSFPNTPPLVLMTAMLLSDPRLGLRYTFPTPTGHMFSSM